MSPRSLFCTVKISYLTDRHEHLLTLFNYVFICLLKALWDEHFRNCMSFSETPWESVLLEQLMISYVASESKCELPSTCPQAPTSWHLNGIKRLWTVIVLCCNSTGFYVRWLRLQRSRSSSSSALPAENWSTLLLDVTVECIPSTPTAFPYLFSKTLFRLSDSNQSVTHKTQSFAQPYFVFVLNENLSFSIFRRNWRQLRHANTPTDIWMSRNAIKTAWVFSQEHLVCCFPW